MSKTLHMIDRAFWRAVPLADLWVVRSYIDSNSEADQAKGRAYCEQYGLNYSEARAQVMREMNEYEAARLARMLEVPSDGRRF